MNRPKQTIVMLDELIKFAEEAHTEVATTEHPVKNIDDGTEPNKEGKPAAEKTKDVKDMVGDASIDAQAKSATIRELLRKKAESGATPSGIDQVAGGIYRAGGDEDPKVNTAALKGGHSEPGTKHPAAMDNSAINSNKYGSANTAALVAALRKQASAAGTMLASDLSKAPGPVVPPVAAAPAATPAKTAAAAAAAPAPRIETMLLDGTITKEAADRLVVTEIAAFVKEAQEDAVALASMLRDTAGQYKIANDPMMPPMDGGMGAPPGDMGGMGAPPMDGGGMPPPPMDGGMGAPPEPAPGGGGDPLEQLLPLIEQATPEQIEQVIAVLSGGGGAPAGGAPPAPAAPAESAPPSAPPAEPAPKEKPEPKDDAESKEASLTTAKVIREILNRK